METLKAIINSQPQTSQLQTVFRWLAGAFLLYTGTGHLTFSRQEFLAQVPNWVPLNGDLVVVLSGIAELLLGVMLIGLGRYRASVGWLVTLFLVAVFPGNISQYVNHRDAFGLNSDTSRFLRLFLQPVFIIWILWATGGWEAWKHRNDETEADY